MAVVDTGVQLSHPRTWRRGVVRAATRPTTTPARVDDNGHGTAVAGGIAATANTIGVTACAAAAGSCPSRWQPTAPTCGPWRPRASCGPPTTARSHQHELRRTDRRKCAQDVIRYARAEGVVVIGSAGNYGTTAPSIRGLHRGDQRGGIHVLRPALYLVERLDLLVEVSARLTWAWETSQFGGFAAPARQRRWSPHRGPGGSRRGRACGRSGGSILKAATVETPFMFTTSGRIDAFMLRYRANHGNIPSSPALVPSGLWIRCRSLLSRRPCGYRYDGPATCAVQTAHRCRLSPIPQAQHDRPAEASGTRSSTETRRLLGADSEYLTPVTPLPSRPRAPLPDPGSPRAGTPTGVDSRHEGRSGRSRGRHR